MVGLALGGFKEPTGGKCHVLGSVLGGFKDTIGGFTRSELTSGDG